MNRTALDLSPGFGARKHILTFLATAVVNAFVTLIVWIAGKL